MKIITNQKLVKRNQKIGQITTFASLGVLALGLYLSFKQVYISWSFLALMVGFILSQIGIFYGSRWGRSPRPDESITAALKGLDAKYSLYHYSSPVSHLLIGPAGIWILSPYYQKGTITYNEHKKRWVQKGGNLYMKIFAQEGMGRPDLEIQRLKEDMEKYIKKTLPDTTFPEIQTALVFTNETTQVEADNAPAPTLHIKKLKDFIRRQAKENLLNQELITILEEKLPKEENPST
ncbi:MAG: NERD domain-containing protein [Chloroflexi bacterium]|nr:NERD domain-containing protein [Chloroflexota bacterium]